jgi:hypothetical protein
MGSAVMAGGGPLLPARGRVGVLALPPPRGSGIELKRRSGAAEAIDDGTLVAGMRLPPLFAYISSAGSLSRVDASAGFESTVSARLSVATSENERLARVSLAEPLPGPPVRSAQYTVIMINHKAAVHSMGLPGKKVVRSREHRRARRVAGSRVAPTRLVRPRAARRGAAFVAEISIGH